jgi:hypothetical protein
MRLPNPRRLKFRAVDNYQQHSQRFYPVRGSIERLVADNTVDHGCDFAGTAASGLSPEASLFAKKGRGDTRRRWTCKKALMKRAGNQLPKELEAKLAQLSKMAAARQRERE